MSRSALLAVLLLALTLGGCGDTADAVARGDRLWADSSYTAALAEYRLALERGDADEEVLLRAAHAFAETGQLERAIETYDRLLARAPEHADQAVYDYLALAHDARERADRYGMAGAIEAALELRPELPVPALAADLAHYYEQIDRPERALAFYERALAHAPPDSLSGLLYEIGRIHESREECGAAIGYFRSYRERAPEGPHAVDAKWYTGRCAYVLAREAHEAGNLTNALRHVDTVLELEAPETVQDEAWFLRGEILYALGRYDPALAAYREVLQLNPARTGRLVERAEERIDRIRFRL